MDQQEVFNKVYRHLLTQGERSESTFTVDGIDRPGCAYRGDEGRKCAIGCLIDDDRYTPELETRGAGHPLVEDALGYSLLSHDDRCLLKRLQDVHDCRNPASWAASLKGISETFGLTVPEIS